MQGSAPGSRVAPAAVSGATYALAVLFAINMMNFFDRQILGVVGEQIGILNALWIVFALIAIVGFAVTAARKPTPVSE